MLPNVQHTLAKDVSCTGVGLHSGQKVRLTLSPAEENAGITFIRKDVVGFDNLIAADFRNVTDTNLGTSLANDDGTMVSTVEHLMAALWGCGVDNATVLLEGPEVPIMDGSAEPFVFLVECAGLEAQKAPRKIIEVMKPIQVQDANKHVSLAPAAEFSIALEIDFNSGAIANQRATFSPKDVSFKTDLCRARTFGFDHEVEQLRKMGLAKGGSLDNAIVVSGDKVLNREGLRYNNEFVRHKILDCIGDLYLIGGTIRGAFSGYRSGHGLNNKVLRTLMADDTAWRLAAV